MIRRTRVITLTVVVFVVVVLTLWTQTIPKTKNSGDDDGGDTTHNKVQEITGRNYRFDTFGGSVDINNAMDQCRQIAVKHNVTISDERETAFDVARFLRQFKSELSQWQPMMESLIDDQIVSAEWFKWERFGGLAVWLALSQIWVMVLRVIYTELGDRRQPRFSVVLVEAMDHDLNPVSEANGVTYPYLAPIPFESVNQKELLVGPEDPRVVLVGDDNVVVVYNMWYDGRRRMYMMSLLSATILKPVELKLSGSDQDRHEKNWTPFYDTNHPNSLQFVYRWEHFQVVRCNLSGGDCVIVTGSYDDLKRPILALRGGTPLVPIPGGWMGFARAHLLDCGCGFETYRPNMVIVTTDESGGYCLSDVSGYVDFDVPMTLWEGEANVCDMKALRPNAMVPNGLDRDQWGRWRLWYSINDRGVASLALNGDLGIMATSPQCRRDQLHLYCALGESYQRCTDYFFHYGVGEYSPFA